LVEYIITEEILRNREDLLRRAVHAHAMVDGQTVVEVDGVVGDYQSPLD
jgi:hypothetical protein